MKHAANFISAIRVILSISLIWLYNNTTLFIIVYLACGLSDILDGYIARKSNTQSILGAKLDSAADIVLFGIITSLMVVWMGDEWKAFLPFIIAVIVIRCVNLVIASYKFHMFAMIHTWGNKIAGLAVFITPLLFIIWNNGRVILPVGIIAILAAIEESVILITSKKLEVNRRSIWMR